MEVASSPSALPPPRSGSFSSQLQLATGGMEGSGVFPSTGHLSFL